MGGSQRLPTMDERLRNLEDEYKNNERIKKAIIEGMKDLRMSIEEIQKAEQLTNKDIEDLKVHIALLDKVFITNPAQVTAVKEETPDAWITQTQVVKILNEKYGFNLPLTKGLTSPLVSAGYVIEYNKPDKSGRNGVRYRLTDAGKSAGWLRESSGNISVLGSKLDEARKVVSAYYRNLYKED